MVDNIKKTMTDAPTVEAIFRNLKGCLPTFVPMLPSLRFAVAVGGIVFLIGLLIVRHLYKRFVNAPSEFDQHMWIVGLVVVLYVTQHVVAMVKRTHYTFASVSLNKQHYANIHWIQEYKNALR
jgi:hypothetical protein